MDQHALQFLKNLIQAENKGYNFKDFVFGTSLNSTDNNFKLKILRNLSSKYGIYAVKKGNLDFLDPLTSIDIGIDPPPDFKNIQNIFLESTVSGDDRLKLSKHLIFLTTCK